MDPKDYIDIIKKAGVLLQDRRDQELRDSGRPSSAIESLTGPFRYAIRAQPPSLTSGLVQYQFYIAGLKK